MIVSIVIYLSKIFEVNDMFDFEEELKKFKPSLEVEDIENAVYQEDLSDMTDILREMMDQKK
jgi:hypothetical protein